MDVIRTLREILDHTGWTQAELAEELDTTQATVSRWLKGADPSGRHRDAIRALANKSASNTAKPVPVMGYIGAGGEVLPEYEQVPPEGLDQVEVPFATPDEIIALEVRGDSMLPRYHEGDVLLVWREQNQSAESLLGEEVAVRLDDGRRFVKRLTRGRQRGTYNLESWNAYTIEDVRLEWWSAIYLIVPRGQIRRIEQRERAARSRAAERRARETAGMGELPFKRPG